MNTEKHSLLTANIKLNETALYYFLATLFFCSGCSALIYQIMWQRMLYTVFGTDLFSITIIVSVFMFGLGIGGLVGGYIADRYTNKLLHRYVIIELGIALFGAASPHLIYLADNYLFSSNEAMTAFSCFLLLSIPTILMGATFPILVTHVNQQHHNIGSTVGGLYFANTLGGATGAYLAGFVLLYTLDLPGAIYFAALLNFGIAFAAYVIFRSRK